MRIPVTRKQVKFMPDSSRVVARFFDNGEKRTKNLITRILTLSEEEVNCELEHTLREFTGRHRNIAQIFGKHCQNFQGLIKEMEIDYSKLSEKRKLLIGSYSTMEYSIESAAFFNPSIVEDFDQSFLNKGEKRVILSFRATGEGHLSSIVFRRGILDDQNNFHSAKVRKHIDMAVIGKKKSYNKKRFIQKMDEMRIPAKYSSLIMEQLPNKFEYYQLKSAVNALKSANKISNERKLALEEMTWLVDSYYDLEFKIDSDISERIIFPVSEAESQGIEDARFVRFTEDDGSINYYATYTAYNGHAILPKLLSTVDFCSFRIMPMHGNGAQNKNFALFPNKIKGQYAMLARIDGVNNYLMFSDRVTLWNDPILLQEPRFPWEFTQIGNCGPPLLTSEGWLVITHGVGPMRRYCIGASLFDLDDPRKEIGRLKEPLLVPLEEEREGYVPNVVYSCGALIHAGSLILPYAVSDYSSSYVVVDLAELLSTLRG